MAVEKLVAFGFSLAIFGQGWLIGRRLGTWISPAGIFSFFWFIFTFLPLVLFSDVPVPAEGVAYIFVACVVFSCGGLIVPRMAISAETAERRERLAESFDRLPPIVLILASASISLMIFDLIRLGIPLSFSLQAIMETSGSMAERRYVGEAATGISVQISFLSMYTAATLGGLSFSRRNRRWAAVIMIAALAPSIFQILFLGNKGALPLVVVRIWSGVLVRKLLIGRLNLVEMRSLPFIVLGLAMFLPLFLISFLARGLYDSTDTYFVLQQLRLLFGSYSSGHFYAFSDWFSWWLGYSSDLDYNQIGLSNGFYTFMSIFRIFGDDRPIALGVYNEYFYYRNVLETNVYTIYRGLLLDFGLFGSLLVLGALSILFHMFYIFLRYTNNPIISIAVFTYFVGFAYSSMIISQLIWNSPVAAAMVIGFILWLNAIWLHRPKKILAEA